MQLSFVVNVMPLKEVKLVAKYTSYIGQFIVVVDSFTENKKYHNENQDESDGTYIRPMSLIRSVFEENGWK